MVIFFLKDIFFEIFDFDNDDEDEFGDESDGDN